MSFRTPPLRQAPLSRAMSLLVLGLAVTLGGLVPGRAAAQGRSELHPGPPIEGEILVKYRPGVVGEARAEARSVLGNGTRRLKEFAFIRSEHLTLPPGLSIEKALERLRRNPNVEHAEPNYQIHILAIPNARASPSSTACAIPGRRAARPALTSAPRTRGTCSPAIRTCSSA